MYSEVMNWTQGYLFDGNGNSTDNGNSKHSAFFPLQTRISVIAHKGVGVGVTSKTKQAKQM